jgi:hypothetical protein
MPYADPEKRRECQRRCQARWYAKNKAKQMGANRRWRRSISDRLSKIRVALGCAVCGEKHPAVLDFHHIDPTKKTMNFSDDIMRGLRSLDQIIVEIGKCTVLCSNCHRKLHWEQRMKSAKGL